MLNDLLCEPPNELGERILNFLRDIHCYDSTPESIDVDDLLSLISEYVNKNKSNKFKGLIKGSHLGLCDTNGKEFKVGSIVRRSTDINTGMHGSWVDYEITVQGTTPLMKYLRSETGEVLPKGYTGCFLSDVYDMKLFVFANDSMILRPTEDLFIQDT